MEPQQPDTAQGATPQTGKDKAHISSQLRGEVMAFAAQSALCGIGMNFVEPYINHRVQKHYAPEDAVTHKPQYGSYLQNLGGELAGDLTGAGTLMALELLCPQTFHSTSRNFRKIIDPLYDSVAHRVFAADKGTPDYQQKIDDWKTFQERNLVRSMVVATGAIAGNVATQKLLIKNPAPTRLVFAGKLVSTAVTTVLGLATRFAFPKHMDALDERISKKYFSKMLDPINAPAHKPVAEESVESYAERLRKQTDEYMASGKVPDFSRS